MGVNNMSPVVIKGLSYGLPAITLLFTAWLPSSLQLSFFVSGVASFLQSQLFRNPAFRARFNMQPLPDKPVDPFTKPAERSPYQDRVVVVPKSGYSHASPVEPTYEPPRSTGDTEAPKKTIFSGLKKEFTTVVESGRKAARETVESSKKAMGAGPKTPGVRTKAELRAALKYEEERSAEEKKKRFEADEARRQAHLDKRNRKPNKHDV